MNANVNILRALERSWLAATFVLVGLIGLNLLIQVSLQWVPSFLTFQLGFSVLTLALPFTLASLSRAIRRDVPSIIGRLEVAPIQENAGDALRPPRTSWILAGGLVMLIAGTFSTEIFGIPWTGIVRLLFYTWALCFFVGYGIAACLYFFLMLYANSISRIRIHADVFSWPRAELNSLFAVYMRQFVIGAVLYVGAVVTVWISPGGAWIAQNTGVGRLWVFPPGAMVIMFFLQFNLCFRGVLVRLRQSSEDKLSEIIESRFHAWAEAPADALSQSIDSLLKWRDTIRAEETWPLNYKSILVTIATLLLPTVKAMVDLL